MVLSFGWWQACVRLVQSRVNIGAGIVLAAMLDATRMQESSAQEQYSGTKRMSEVRYLEPFCKDPWLILTITWCTVSLLILTIFFCDAAALTMESIIESVQSSPRGQHMTLERIQEIVQQLEADSSGYFSRSCESSGPMERDNSYLISIHPTDNLPKSKCFL